MIPLGYAVSRDYSPQTMLTIAFCPPPKLGGTGGGQLARPPLGRRPGWANPPRNSYQTAFWGGGEPLNFMLIPPSEHGLGGAKPPRPGTPIESYAVSSYLYHHLASLHRFGVAKVRFAPFFGRCGLKSRQGHFFLQPTFFVLFSILNASYCA